MHIHALKSGFDILKRLWVQNPTQPEAVDVVKGVANSSLCVAVGKQAKKKKQASHLSWERLELQGASLRTCMQNLTHVVELVIWRAHTRLWPGERWLISIKNQILKGFNDRDFIVAPCFIFNRH